jgi:acyl dehydratase
MIKGSAITEKMKKSIGTRLFQDFPADEVSMWAIRRFIEATTDENPLWQDERYAKKTRWGGIIAPPAFLHVFDPANRAFRQFPDLSHMATTLPFDPPFLRTFQAFYEFQFFVPLRPGDNIKSMSKIGDVYEREGKSGRMVFIRIDNEHRNQKKELVGITSEAMVSIEGSPSSSRSTESATFPPEELKLPIPTGKQVCFEDVEVGTLLPKLEKSISLVTILKWGAAVNDYGPHHYDQQFAHQVLGLPNVIAHGPHNAAFLAQLVTNWIGSEGFLKRHYTELRSNVFPGDTLTFQGKVTRKYQQFGENLVECESWAENQNGRKVALGKSTFTLPLRKKTK